MTIAVNDSLIARWSGTPAAGVAQSMPSAVTVSTGDFLVLCSTCDTLSTPDSDANLTLTFSQTGTASALTWTQRVKKDGSAASPGHAGIWTTTVGTGGTLAIGVARTSVTGDSSGLRVSFKVYKVTGQHASPIGATGSGSSATNNLSPNLYTATASSRVFYCGTDWNALGVPTSTDTADAATYTGSISVMSAYKSANSTSGSVVVGNLDAAGTAAAAWNWAALEIIDSSTAPVTGTLSQTIAAITVSSATTVRVAGTLSQSVGNISISAAGFIGTGSPTNGVLAQTIAPITSVAAATVKVSAAVTATIAPIIAEKGFRILEWDGADDTHTGYYVYWGLTAPSGNNVAAPDNYTNQANVLSSSDTSANTLSYLIPGLIPGRTYYADITTHGAGGHDAFESLLGTPQSFTPSVPGSAAVLSQSIGSISLVATGVVGQAVIQAALVQTIAPITSVAAATVKVSGVLAQTVSPISSVATSTVLDTAVLAQTLAPVTVIATAQNRVSAVLSQNIGVIGISAQAVGLSGVLANFSQTIAPITSVSTAAVTVSGVLSQTIAPIALVAVGIDPVAAVLSESIGTIGLTSAFAIGGGQAVLAQTISDLVLTSAATVLVSGVTNAPIGSIQITANGLVGSAAQIALRQTFRDGVQVAQNPSTTSKISFAFRDQVQLGWFRFSPVYYSGDMAEVIVFPDDLSDAELHTWHTSAQAYWNTYTPPPPVTEGPGPKLQYVGINLSGYESGFGDIGPTTASIDYWSNRFANIVRLPFDWERLQPTLFGPLDTTNLNKIKATVDYIVAKGQVCILDLHNYGKYNTGSGSTSLNVTPSNLADLWSKVATVFASYPLVWFDIMNEPVQTGASTWLPYINASIAAIRAAGAMQKITVPASGGSRVSDWFTNNNLAFATGIVDSANNYVIQVHQYFDTGYSGTSGAVTADFIGQGVLSPLSAWARYNGIKLFYGEFGSGDSATAIANTDNVIAHIQQYADVWLGCTLWGGGGRWTDTYQLRAEGLNGTDLPHSMAVMAYAPGGAKRGYLQPVKNVQPLTLTTPSFATSTYGQALIDGYGVGPNKMIFRDIPITVDVRFSISVNPSVVVSLWGQGGQCYVNINQSGKLTATYGAGSNVKTLVSTTVVTTGADFHGRFCLDSVVGGKLYVNGVLEASNTTTPAGAGMSIGGFFPAVRTRNGNGASSMFPGSLDWVAHFHRIVKDGNFTPPTTPWTGTEDDIAAIWNLDGDGAGYAGGT